MRSFLPCENQSMLINITGAIVKWPCGGCKTSHPHPVRHHSAFFFFFFFFFFFLLVFVVLFILGLLLAYWQLECDISGRRPVVLQTTLLYTKNL